MRGLEERGLLLRVDGRRYRLGFGVVELGQRALRTLELREPLHSIAVTAAKASGATCVVAQLSERADQARIIIRADGGALIQVALEVGHTWPLHAGAMAKSILAYHPERETFLRGPLERIGVNTVVDPDTLRAQLEEIRKQGWAASSEETDTGAWGVAAPVLVEDEYPICSIGLIEPLQSASPQETRRLLKYVRSAADEASRTLSRRG